MQPFTDFVVFIYNNNAFCNAQQTGAQHDYLFH